MYIKKILFAVMILVFLQSGFFFCDEAVTGWKGYSLYNLNHSAIEISEEKSSIEIDKQNINLSGTYLITNNTSDSITASIGMPDNYITEIAFKENDKPVRLKSKTVKSLTAQLADGSTLPQVINYYTFNLTLKAGESKTLRLDMRAYLQKDAQGNYNFAYFNDRNEKNAIKSNDIKLDLTIKGFKPYNIVDNAGFKAQQLSDSGQLSIEYKSIIPVPIKIKYLMMDNAVLEKLSSSGYKAPKAIANAFLSKDYQTAADLCDAYLNNPVDKKLSVVQIQLVKAECLRNLARYDAYLDTINGIDVSKLYPDTISYKLLFDKLNVYKIQNKNKEMSDTVALLETASKENRTYLYDWLEVNNYISTIVEAPSVVETKTETPKPIFSAMTNRIKVFSKYVKQVDYKYLILLVIGFIAGIIFEKLMNNRRKKRSMYLFRR